MKIVKILYATFRRVIGLQLLRFIPNVKILLSLECRSLGGTVCHAKSIIYAKCELKCDKFSLPLFMVGKLCVQFGTEAVYVRVMLKDFFKKVVYCGLMFFPLENHKTLKKSWEKELKREREVHQQEREVLMNQIKDFQQELQSVKVSVCCKHLELRDYWDMLLLVCDRTL